MTTYIRSLTAAFILSFTAMLTLFPCTAQATSKAKIDQNVNAAIPQLLASSPAARQLWSEAKAVLVFPSILKMGFIIGVQGGNGALRVGDVTVGYYNTASASYGLQAGIQEFGYALFFMSDSALQYLKKSGGWEIGIGPSIVVVDAGIAKALTTTTARKEIYAFFFSQKGLMAGLGLQGSKITRIDPD
jgi:lipid-binding SYLF domain-containing protein